MNEYGKAIDYLRGLSKSNRLFLAYANNSNDQILMRQAESAINNINMSIAALKKQVPKEADHIVEQVNMGDEYEDEDIYICPICRTSFYNVYPNYCDNCGQRLK